MKVYLLIEDGNDYDTEWTVVKGVFSSKEKAIEYISDECLGYVYEPKLNSYVRITKACVSRLYIDDREVK